jgi:hypothetical protein
MRYADFEVPNEVITDFVKEMEEREMKALIVGVNDDDELVLKMGYERDEADKVDELEDRLEELVATVYEDEEEEEEETETRRRRR